MHDLGSAIVSGRLLPGEQLSVEAGLATQFGVSKTVIREAVRALAAKGLVVARPRTGTRVLPERDWHHLDPDVLTWRAAELGASEAYLRDLDEFRLAVEPAAAELAARRATPADLEALARALDRMTKDATNAERFFDADIEFHTGILSATHNVLFVGLIRAVASALSVRHGRAAEFLFNHADAVPGHSRVLQAIEAGRPNAAGRAMKRLLDATALDDDRMAHQD